MMSAFLNRIAPVYLGLLVVLAPVATHAADKQPMRPSNPSFPQLDLGKHAKGERAIEALGTRLPEIANAYALTSDDLKERLRRDKHLGVDRHGRLFFSDEFEIPQEATTASVVAAGATTPYPLDQTFLLHSKAGALRVIYLDFDGYVMSGTAWNSGYNGGNTINCPAWDIDGNPASFGDSERTVIQQVWQRVAEDYAPFDVDVTTEYPGEAALTRSSSSDQNFGVRVLISPISSYFGNYGGIAYIGVFDDVGDTYKPALVFPENLANSEKYIAEAASHEAGHNLGLYHDGTTTGSAYYSGQGSGEVGWAPIMGVGYYKNLTQWSKGQYANANNTQDDLAVITATGLSYRPDDHGNTAATASYFPAGSTLSATGIIERNTDVDVFAFTTGAGSIAINVAPWANGANLDIVALLYNSSGGLVASNNPATQLAASISATVDAGTYFLHVRGTGAGDPLTTGYSGYASLGQYTITGTVVSPSGPVPPVAVAGANTTSGTAPVTISFDGSGSFDQDGTIATYAWNFGDGATDSGASVSHTYSGAGNYTATLTVTDNTGLTGSDAVAVTVTAPNASPVAVMTAAPTNGTAALTVAFDGSGSSDPDGSIVSYSWNFGDGASGSGSSVSHTYSSAGTYTAVLTVTDNLGATNTASKTITVQQAITSVMHVASIQLAVDYTGGGKRVRATVRIVDANNNAVSGATVAGVWSGLTSGTSSGTTDANGNVLLRTARFKKTGTVMFAVTNVTKLNAQYDSSLNTVTQVSISAAPKK